MPEVAVLGISVAALMHVDFVRRKLQVPSQIDKVVLPGWCQGDLSQLETHFGKPFERGPKDLHDLPEFFGEKNRRPSDLSQFDIEILAEINHAPRLSDAEILHRRKRCEPTGPMSSTWDAFPAKAGRARGRHAAAVRRRIARVDRQFRPAAKSKIRWRQGPSWC